MEVVLVIFAIVDSLVSCESLMIMFLKGSTFSPLQSLLGISSINHNQNHLKTGLFSRVFRYTQALGIGKGMPKVNATFSAIDCKTYLSDEGCGANFVLNI